MNAAFGRRALRLSAVAAVMHAVCAWVSPHVARACSTVLIDEPKLVGTPADGDTGVPTDVIPYYQYPIEVGQEGATSGHYALTSTDGAAVAVMVRLGPDMENFEIVPAQELEPNTEYVLRAQWMGPTDTMVRADELHFTTGDGPLADPPAPPVARLVNYHLTSNQLSSCSPPPFGTCISISDDDAFTIATYIDSFNQEQDSYGVKGSYFGINISGMEEGTDFTCVLLQTRAANGKLSDPVKLCGADFPITDVDGTEQIDCSSKGLTFDAPQPPPDGGDAGTKTVDAGGTAGDAGAPVLGKPQNDPSAPHDAGMKQPAPDPKMNPAPAPTSMKTIDGVTPHGNAKSSGCSTTPDASSSPQAAAGLCALAFALRRRQRSA